MRRTIYSNIEYFDKDDQGPKNPGIAPSEFLRQDLYVTSSYGVRAYP
jgi:hypothetical protein